MLRNEHINYRTPNDSRQPYGVVAPKTKRKGEVQMNRDYLRSLGLEDEVIDSIMSRHGSVISQKEDEITKLNGKISTLEDEADDVDVDEETAGKIENLEKERDELKVQLADQAKQHKLETYVNSLGTKDPAYVTDKLSDVEIEDGEFVEIDDRVEELKEKHPLLFEADESDEDTPPPKPKPWSQGNSSTSGGEISVAEIMKVEDRQERQRLIQKHSDLF